VSRLISQGVSIRLTPMQLTEMPPARAKNWGDDVEAPVDAADAAPQSKITVLPGEICRVILTIKNWEAQPQFLTLTLDGTFPSQWCQLQTAAASSSTVAETLPLPGTTVQSPASIVNPMTVEVPAKKTWQADLWFLIPGDFFEGQGVWQETHRNTFQTVFEGCLSVYQDLGQPFRALPIQQCSFTLNIQPQSDYVTFLPIVYQEVDFIHHFIKIFEQAFDPVVNSFSSMWANLDPLTAPQSLLPFLAHWVDWPMDTQLGVLQQRKLIRRAVEIYRWRGTRKGLRYYLHLYTGLPLDEMILREEDKAISITEPFGQGCVLGVAHMGEDAILGGGKSYHFEVRLCTQPNTPIDERLVRRILDQEKPVFCTYGLHIEPAPS
jgi:phage tail-like protein